MLDFLLSKSSRYINKDEVYMNHFLNTSFFFLSGTVKKKIRKGEDK